MGLLQSVTNYYLVEERHSALTTRRVHRISSPKLIRSGHAVRSLLSN